MSKTYRFALQQSALRVVAVKCNLSLSAARKIMRWARDNENSELPVDDWEAIFSMGRMQEILKESGFSDERVGQSLHLMSQYFFFDPRKQPATAALILPATTPAGDTTAHLRPHRPRPPLPQASPQSRLLPQRPHQHPGPRPQASLHPSLMAGNERKLWMVQMIEKAPPLDQGRFGMPPPYIFF